METKPRMLSDYVRELQLDIEHNGDRELLPWMLSQLNVELKDCNDKIRKAKIKDNPTSNKEAPDKTGTEKIGSDSSEALQRINNISISRW